AYIYQLKQLVECYFMLFLCFCASKWKHKNQQKVFFLIDCSLSYPLGKHVIHEVSNVSFSHLACDDQAAVVVHWSASPLGIEHIKGFRVYLEDKNPDGKQCQHLILKDPRQLNYSFRSTVRPLSSQPFSSLTFDTDYMVRVVPFPSLMNESFFPPSFLRTNCKTRLDELDELLFWKPKTLNVSQLGSNLHVTFDLAPSSFNFQLYYLYYRLRQDGLVRVQRCRPDLNQARTTCVLQDVTPGTYVIEVHFQTLTFYNYTIQICLFCRSVHSPWAGPIRAMAITVPLVIMSAFATLFTVVCRKKQQENIYSQLDEESSESSNQSAALNSERPWPRPKVFICYSNRDCPKHTSVIQSFAYFLQDFCGCEVVLDLWEHLEMCKEGQMSWLSRQLDEANFIITVCSKGLRYYMEKKSRRGKTPIGRRSNSSSGSPTGGSHGDLFVVAVAMIAEKLRLVKQNADSGDPELSRFMAVYFDYSTESDIPTALSLAPRLKLMDQLPQLYGQLHSSRSALADPEQQPDNISRRNYFRSKSGRSLYVSICNMHQHISQNPDWFEKQPSPPGASSPEQRFDSGVVLNEVLVRTPSMEGLEEEARRNVLLLAAGSISVNKIGPS
uniref:Interleukin-17 receptor D n=1 Tax=Xiphophorus couchianus TaxID=32473 RepID=A0A3B5LNQ8_9TELE